MEEDDPVALYLSLDNWQEPQDNDEEFLPYKDSESESQYPLSVDIIMANIVGLRYFTGNITDHEMVGLVRVPNHLRIKVLNTRSQEVGYLEDSVAAVLSPLMDSRTIFVEATVHDTRAASNLLRTTCHIHIFSKLEDCSSVERAIVGGGLTLIRDGKEISAVDYVFNRVQENVSKKGAVEVLEPPEDVIKSELFVHQKEGLGWLVNRENSEELPPFWDQEKVGSYVNLLTNYHTNVRPEPLRGGVFADDMGLGKTLTLLSLIALDKLKMLDEMDEEDSGSKGKRGRTSKMGCAGSEQKRKIGDRRLDGNVKGKPIGFCDNSSPDFSSKTTLIVCPSSVFATWQTQLREHANPKKLNVYMYYGNRTKDVEVLKKYDIVLTSYGVLASESCSAESPVRKIEWWRVILDEAHRIMNVNAQQSEAVTNLMAKRRWVVTGMPILNGSFDLYSFMTFLRFEPFSIQSYWQRFVQRPLIDQSNPKGLLRLKVLMATISLRRTKEMGLIGLPPKTIETRNVYLSREEREEYDRVQRKAKTSFERAIAAGRLSHNNADVLSRLLLLRQICLHLDLCPADHQSLLASPKIQDVSKNPELQEKMSKLLQDNEDFVECPICYSSATEIITSCGHTFCRNCILTITMKYKSSCPYCRRHLKLRDLFSAEGDDSGVSISSKVSKLLELLLESKNQNQATKSVIFSKFPKMLILLEEPLKAAGYKILRLDGSINAKRRTQVIKEFGIPGQDGPTILLASLKASGTGINLTAASRVYLLEPWWNPAVEDQAMGRVHQCGQKESVQVVRLITRDTIEERILELSERKRKLAEEGGRKDNKEINSADIRALLQL